jgi:hypothetical protein
MRRLDRSLADYLALAEPNEEGCRIWPLAKNHRGYGVVSTFGRGHGRLVHGVVYELVNGPLPKPFQVGHICHDRAVATGTCSGGDQCRHRPCFEPSHLEKQTNRENGQRGWGNGNRRKTHCGICDRPLEGDNLLRSALPVRSCRDCANRRSRESRAKRMRDSVKAERIRQQSIEAGRRYRERSHRAG